MSKISFHAKSLIGIREENQDCYSYFLNLYKGKNYDQQYGNVDIFIICDGHGGKEIAKYVVDRLMGFFKKKGLKYPLTEKRIFQEYDLIQSEIFDMGEVGLECGTTALVVVRYLDGDGNEKLQIINLGDCRAVICRNDFAIPLTRDHKPNWPDEKKRIMNVSKKNLESTINYYDEDWRAETMSVTRAFGDINQTPILTHSPQIFDYNLTNEDQFLIIGCDGLWEVMDNHSAVNFVLDHLNDNHIDLYESKHLGEIYENPDDMQDYYPKEMVKESKNLSYKLAEYVYCNGSTDNITVMIIIFN